MKTKFKKTLELLLSDVLLIGLFSGLSAFALEADYDYTVLSDGTVEITYYKGTDANVVIPDTIDGRTVTSIGDSAFLMRTGITSVEIPETEEPTTGIEIAIPDVDTTDDSLANVIYRIIVAIMRIIKAALGILGAI